MRRLGQLNRFIVYGVGCMIALLLCGCDGPTNSSVPAYPVRFEVNTKTVFIDFTPQNVNAYITLDRDGYKENGVWKLPATAMDAWGYGGVVLYVSMVGYVAFDLACPLCAAKGSKSPCEMDGIYAVCPNCGEEYEVASGYGFPRKGISKEAMRRLNTYVSPNGDIIQVRQ